MVQDVETERPLIGRCLSLWEELRSKVKEWCGKYNIVEGHAEKIVEKRFRKNYHPALNKAGLTALEALERCPRDFISLKIEHMLTEAGIQTGTSQQGSSSPPSIATQPSQSKRSKIWETLWLKYLQYQSNWIEEKRGTLMVVATVIATMTFLSAISSSELHWC